MWRFAKEKTCGFIAAQLDTPMDVKLEQQTGDSWLKRPSHTETIPGFSKHEEKQLGNAVPKECEEVRQRYRYLGYCITNS